MQWIYDSDFIKAGTAETGMSNTYLVEWVMGQTLFSIPTPNISITGGSGCTDYTLGIFLNFNLQGVLQKVG